MRRFTASEAYLARAERVIPLGSQTFSKSRTQYPFGISPYFITRAQGAHCWDLDGNEYIDFVSSLASVTLGYNDPDVTRAVAEQLQSGVIFSLPHPIEAEVAELICELVPCAERVRFGKNGSDATAGAVRVARAFTGRDRVAVCGYHGWQDWYIGSTTRDLGVPEAVKALTHKFNYNDLASLEAVFAQYPGQIAAVILEPMNVQYPVPGFLEGVQALARKEGAVLVFDETITGFRYALGGAQQFFGITPDMATFGKGMANGYPVSAVVGKRELMRYMEDIFFSGTFGGETLSLAAACAVIDKLRREPVIDTLTRQGERIIQEINRRIEAHGVSDLFAMSGHPTWSFLNIQGGNGYSVWQVRTLFLQEMFARGILTLGTHNLSYAHGEAELQMLLAAYDEVLPLIRTAVHEKTLEQVLRCPALEPLFKVR